MAFSGRPDEEVLSVQSHYDEKGNLVEEFKIDDDDGTNERIVYMYNDQGKLIRHEHLMENEGISESFVYTRDEKGRVTCEWKHYGDDPGEKIVYHYEAHNQPVKIERYDADGDAESFETIIYNEKDQLIEHHKLAPDETFVEKTVITYNEKELPVEKHVYNNKGDVIQTTAINYNDKNEVIRVTEWNADGKVTSDITSTYDEKGNVTERKIKDFHSRTLRFAYDDNDNCISEETYDEHGNLVMRSTYEFDEHNHLTAESGYLLNTSGSGKHGNSHSRYEYEFWE